ncbi:PREDICTED: elongation of very long chain fatty acids protein AAEL008004-like [Vollenhovia emeryi]|uniref:elongation of very long chain fatty acids protein AAEL008004-like n=1 Tax=Vollenhovia emeryi TaxID=411798 RepID=UPI0005F4D16D|nr:PREDICTED: elongation of very long chain fatty acids protein AAEL008004-like [Vollenhovia emeryi]
MGLEKLYNYFMDEPCPETREWVFVYTPLPILLITAGYLYFILHAGPNYMKNRPPYKLRTFILIYDTIQILANLWFIKRHMDAGWLSAVTKFRITDCGLSLKTLLPFDPNFIDDVWWGLMLKLFDYIETCVFVLRKKQKQVSGLHIFHHVSNVTFVWYSLKYFLDVRVSYISLLNCIAHVIMYIYYFIAAWSPNLQQMISPLKPYVTRIQMVQFILMIVPLMQFPYCDGPKGMAILFIINLVVFLYLFYDFYKKTYTSKQKSD